MKYLSVLIALLISSIAFASTTEKDPCASYLTEPSHRWQDLRIKPIKIIRLDECVISYADAETVGIGGDDNTMFVSRGVQVVRSKGGNLNGVFAAENVGRKGLKEGQSGVVTYCDNCHALLQIILEK